MSVTTARARPHRLQRPAMATGVVDGVVDAAVVTADMRARCKELGIAAATPTDVFLERCLCVMRNGNSGKHCTDSADRLTSDDQVQAADDLYAQASNATEPEPTDEPDDNLINSDVFIYVIVFIVIVYFLTFLYLCMKKRQREAEDAEAVGGLARPRSTRNAEQDRPPAYDEVMSSSGAVGGKGSEPPTYAEVLARSQQLDQLDKAEQGAAS